MLPCGNSVPLRLRKAISRLTWAVQQARRQGAAMAIEKCINEFDVDDVIFEEGSTGRELFVVLDGKVDIAKMNGGSKTVIVTLGKGEFFGEMAVIDGCTLIQAAEDVYQIRFKNRAANAYLVRGSARTIMIDVGLSTNYPHLVTCLNHLGVSPEKIDMVVLSHEHLDHIGAAYHFHGRTYIAAHRLAANKIMLRDDFSMLRKMFNEPNVPINIDIWLEEGNLIDLGNFRLNVMYTPGHTSACISLFDQNKGLLFAADTLMPGGVMGGVFGSGSISDYIQSLERLKGLNSKILLSGHGRLSDTPQDDVRIAIQRSHGLLSDTAQLFDALDARSNFEPIMQSVRDLNKLDDA